MAPETEASIYQLALQSIGTAGRAEILKKKNGDLVVRPDKAMSQALSKKLEQRIGGGASGTKAPGGVYTPGVKLDLSPVYMPVLLRRAVPVVLVIFATGWFLGKVT